MELEVSLYSASIIMHVRVRGYVIGYVKVMVLCLPL